MKSWANDWHTLWLFMCRLKGLSVSVCEHRCVTCLESECTQSLSVHFRCLFDAIILKYKHNCKCMSKHRSLTQWACWPLHREKRNIRPHFCVTLLNCVTHWQWLSACVCKTTARSHPPVQVCFIDNRACMLPVFMDSACICVRSTYGVHSLGKASISSCVYSLSFLGISRGCGSSSVRFARMSSGSSWWGWEGVDKEKSWFYFPDIVIQTYCMNKNTDTNWRRWM